MQKFYSLLFLFMVCFCLASIAQPTVTSQALITLGEAEPIQTLNLSASDFLPGSAGANQTWDFSNLSDGTDSCYYEAMDVSLSPFKDSFPNADVFFICVNESQDGEKVENHSFYIYDGNSMSSEGLVSVSISDPDFDTIFTIYSNPQTVLDFPATLGANFTDTYKANLYTRANNVTNEVSLEGTGTATVDAYGEITTPAGTFQNAIRIYREEVTTNTIFIAGVPITSTNEFYRYTWMAENENYIMLNMDSIVSKDFTGNVVNTSYTGFYLNRSPSPVTSSLLEVSSIISEATVFPNPASNYVRFGIHANLNENMLVRLVSVNGKQIAQKQITFLKNEMQYDTFNLEGLSKGTYIINIVHEGKSIKSIPIVVK